MAPALILFADSYIADPLRDRANAALVAWPELETRPRAYARATTALARDDVRAYIDAMIGEISERIEVTAEKWHAEVARIAFGSLQDLSADGTLLPLEELSRDAAAMLSEVDETEVAGVKKRKYRLHSKMEALKLIGQSLRLLVDRKELSGPRGVPVELHSTMSADEATQLYMQMIREELEK